ncbi:MAG: c-type cytochrome [Gemmataceae bacterium]|nr:c-type cytochrome [Gemmataceae bacterium]
MRSAASRALVCAVLLVGGLCSAGPEVSRHEQGYEYLTKKAYVPASWTRSAYDNVWKQWPGIREKPADYDKAFQQYYGLPPAPFENNGLPLGLKITKPFLGRTLTLDCMVCHGGSMLGKSYIGLGNVTLDIQAIFEDLSAADGIPFKVPFAFTRVRGTTEAGAMGVYLLARRNPDLTLRAQPLDLGVHDNLCEDPPAWWLLKKKKTMYFTGGADQRSVRSIMQFMMSPLTPARAFAEAEPDFAAIRDYLLTIEPPKYPYPIDRARAAEGERLFLDHCAKCHGTYGPDGKYPNKIIPLEEIGTDRTRFDGIEDRFGLYYDQTWFAKEHRGWLQDGYPARASRGYQAPPLNGIWATAPYFHNGSVPTVYDVLNSETRPKRFTRSFGTGESDYDFMKMGWKTTPSDPPDARLPVIRQRRVFDTSRPGQGNSGHSFGDCLTDPERMAIIEYMKTL